MRSHGDALNAVAQSPPLPQLSVLNGYSGRKMCWPATSDGQTIAARNAQRRRIEHHKTGEQIWHPLKESVDQVRTACYADAEAVLAKLPRSGIPMILRQVDVDTTKPYSFSGMQKIVHEMRDKIRLPSTFRRCLPSLRHDGVGGGGID